VGDRGKNWQASCDILNYEKDQMKPVRTKSERDGKICQRTNKGREGGRTELPRHSNPHHLMPRACIYFPHALRKEETKEIWTKWGSNLLLAGKGRCDADEQMVQQQLNYTCPFKLVGRCVPKGLSCSPAFRDHSTPPNQTNQQHYCCCQDI
jgi:hypothetical protein